MNQTATATMLPIEMDLKSNVETVQVINRIWLMLPPSVSTYKHALIFSVSILHALM